MSKCALTVTCDWQCTFRHMEGCTLPLLRRANEFGKTTVMADQYLVR